MSGLIDQWGNPLRKELLTREVAGPTMTGVRNPVASYPGDGLTPVRLAQLLRAADMGEVISFFELAEQIEERDLHYAGVLSTRKRSVSQVDITVEAASDGAEDERRADQVRNWLKRDELSDETFDILDAVGKGVSFTEIKWGVSEGQYLPERLEWRDPRFFKPDRDGTTFLLRGGVDGNSQDEALPAFKFIRHQVKAKSGLPIRSGIGRLAAWNWMFKAYTLRDWAVFTQTYGQPLRVGKFHSGATNEDRNTLFQAVANIAGDCAAIIPQGMEIEFVEAGNLGAGSGLYMERANWHDQQMSKAVLGQTTTTDAISGGHAVSKEHREVQEDIETADCKGLGATCNRDLIRPWMDLENGPPDKATNGATGYPRLVIARPKQENLELLSASLEKLVPLGLRVQQSEVRDKFGLSNPEDDSDLLRAPAAFAPAIVTGNQTAEALQSQSKPAAAKPVPHPARQVAVRMADDAQPAIEDMLSSMTAMMDKANSLEELQAMMGEAFDDLDSKDLQAVLEAGLVAAHAAGISDIADESSAASGAG